MFKVKHYKRVTFAFPVSQLCAYLKGEYNEWVKVSLTNDSHTIPVCYAKCVAALHSFVSDVSYTKLAFQPDKVFVMSTHSFLQSLQPQLCLPNTGSPICQSIASF